ncbi:MAG TPA: hypothetical protein VHD15_17865, partial [Hyphomicrobiales bacterium]|nr:hypothetical protein [Hyphomicrobiales bacterium]
MTGRQVGGCGRRASAWFTSHSAPAGGTGEPDAKRQARSVAGRLALDRLPELSIWGSGPAMMSTHLLDAAGMAPCDAIVKRDFFDGA